MSSNSGLSRRAALRKQQELEERRKRNTRILGIGLGAVAVVVVAIVAIVIAQSWGGKSTAEQLIPPNATDGHGIEVLSQGESPDDDAPHVVVYEDFQCPACAGMFEAYGSAFYQLVDEGKITVEYRMATFMEDQLMNDSSTKAAIAAAAADEFGKFREFHALTLGNQAQDGSGFSDQQLREDFPSQLGIEGDDLERFQQLYDDEAFADFVEDSHTEFKNSGVGSTPSYVVGDQRLEFFDEETEEPAIEPTAEDLYRAITEAGA